jgi:hypothetical protein
MLGPTPFHRRSFAPVQEAINGFQMGLPLGIEAEFAAGLVGLMAADDAVVAGPG